MASRGGLEQDGVDGGLVLEGDGCDWRRNGEDDMEVRHGKQLALACGEPAARADRWHFGQWRLRQEL